MDNKLIRLRQEKMLRQEIWDTIQGDIIEGIMLEAKINDNNKSFFSQIEGHEFRVTNELIPWLSKLLQDVKDCLEFSQSLNLYINNSPHMNASSITGNDQEPNIIRLNSPIIEKFDTEETKFILGHEIGHILCESSRVNELLQFVFPSEEAIPPILLNKIKVWEKLNELSADRFGLIVCKDLKKAVSCMLKISSGLNFSNLNVDFNSFMEDNRKKIDYFRQENLINLSSHPINAIRIKSLELFYNSGFYKDIGYKKDINDENFEREINDLTDLILIKRNSELDYHRCYFIGSAGLIMAQIDSQMNNQEFYAITNTLAEFTTFPELFLQSINADNISDIFIRSIEAIKGINPGESMSMLSYLIKVALCDNNVSTKELEFLYKVGTETLGYSRKEIAQEISMSIGTNYRPQFVMQNVEKEGN